MHRKELINKIVDRAHCTKKEADSILSATLDTIQETVASGEQIKIVGFGSFKKTTRIGRVGKNPKTGEAIDIPNKIVPKFAAGFPFRVMVKDGSCNH